MFYPLEVKWTITPKTVWLGQKQGLKQSGMTSVGIRLFLSDSYVSVFYHVLVHFYYAATVLVLLYQMFLFFLSFLLGWLLFVLKYFVFGLFLGTGDEQIL